MAEALGWEKFPPAWSLGITFAILGAGVAFSLWKTGRGQAPVHTEQPAAQTVAIPVARES